MNRYWFKTLLIAAGMSLAVLPALAPASAHSGERFVPQAILTDDGKLIPVTGETVMLPSPEGRNRLEEVREKLDRRERNLLEGTREERDRREGGSLERTRRELDRLERNCLERARQERNCQERTRRERNCLERTRIELTRQERARRGLTRRERVRQEGTREGLAVFSGNTLYFPDGRVATISGTSLIHPDGRVDTLIYNDRPEAGGRLEQELRGVILLASLAPRRSSRARPYRPG
jgi:hypothetical protein